MLSNVLATQPHTKHSNIVKRIIVTYDIDFKKFSYEIV